MPNHRVHTDYQLGDPLLPAFGIGTSLGQGTWSGWALADFAQWSPCLRSDRNALESAKTCCLCTVLNCRVDVGDVSQVAYLNVFLVTPRRNAVVAIQTQDTPLGFTTALVVYTDNTENANNQGAGIWLNPAKFKVHACKYITLTPQAPSVAFLAGAAIGNPFATWRK